nr:hypothetical protein Iba_chr01aCG5670 [Ipomoea batatas]
MASSRSRKLNKWCMEKWHGITNNKCDGDLEPKPFRQRPRRRRHQGDQPPQLLVGIFVAAANKREKASGGCGDV